MKEKIMIFAVLVLSFAIGSIIGHSIGYIIFDRPNRHLCTCESCKLTRQLEACEVIDSIINERIVINITPKDE